MHAAARGDAGPAADGDAGDAGELGDLADMLKTFQRRVALLRRLIQTTSELDRLVIS